MKVIAQLPRNLFEQSGLGGAGFSYPNDEFKAILNHHNIAYWPLHYYARECFLAIDEEDQIQLKLLNGNIQFCTTDEFNTICFMDQSVLYHIIMNYTLADRLRNDSLSVREILSIMES